MHKKHSSLIHDESRRQSRRPFRIPLPIPTGALSKSSIIYDSKKVFNWLPVCLRKISEERSFRVKLKQSLLELAYYAIEEFFADTFQ